MLTITEAQVVLITWIVIGIVAVGLVMLFLSED
jgi:hypothetical protein